MTPADLCKCAAKLFTFLYDKDIFQYFYMRDLRQRLLTNYGDACVRACAPPCCSCARLALLYFLDMLVCVS